MIIHPAKILHPIKYHRDYIISNVDNLMKLLGKPSIDDNSGDIINYMWECITELHGRTIMFSISDWNVGEKLYPDEEHTWRIYTREPEDSHKIKTEIEKIINNGK